jgi:hypothetical protein
MKIQQQKYTIYKITVPVSKFNEVKFSFCYAMLPTILLAFVPGFFFLRKKKTTIKNNQSNLKHI